MHDRRLPKVMHETLLKSCEHMEGLMFRGERVGRLLKAALGVCVLTMALAAGARPLAAQENYPNRPVRIILPFGAGGVGDTITRLVAEKLSKKLGQRFIVENYPGPGGINAARTTLQAPADGYALTYMASATAMSVNLFERLPFDPVKDFAAVSSLGYFDLTFLVMQNSPYKTLGDFIKAAKEKPGELNVGTILAGSSQNLGMELFKSSTGLNFTIVPFRNSGEVLIGLERNDVQMAAEFYPPVRGGIEAKKFIPLATSGAKRTAYSPNVPTVKEAGGGDFAVTSWSGFFVRAGTPQEPIVKLNAALKEVLADPEVVKKSLDFGVETASSTPEELHDRMIAEIPKWRKVIDNAKIERRKGQ
jgi:tripartite-type tricarboxylate transporter receptor subunit TctC